MEGAAKAATINNTDTNAAIRHFMFMYATSFPAWRPDYAGWKEDTHLKLAIF
jgi:hypothetical protein